MFNISADTLRYYERVGVIPAVNRTPGGGIRDFTEEDVPTWAFRFLQSIPGVTVTLSGMSSMDQLKANIATYETDKQP